MVTYLLSFELIDFPTPSLEDITITKQDPPSAQINKLHKNLDASLKVSKSDSFLTENAIETFIKSVIEEDLKSWSDISKNVSRHTLKNFFATCQTKDKFADYLIKSLNTFRISDKHLQTPTIIDSLCTSSQEIFMHMSRLDSNSFDISSDSNKKSFRSVFSAMLYDEIDDNQQEKNVGLSSEFTELVNALDISMKYDEYAFEYENLEKTMISDVLVEDV